jgi:hypothetical protein
VPYVPNSPWFDLPDNIWGGVQNMKLPIVQLSPFSCYFINNFIKILNTHCASEQFC